MRLIRLACAGIVALAFSSAATAQNSISTSALTNVKPTDVQFRKVDTANVMGGTPSLSSIGQSRFSLTSFFRKMSPFGSPTLGTSRIPAPQYSNPIAPKLPINSTVEIRR